MYLTSAGIGGKKRHALFKKIIIKATVPVLMGNRQKILVRHVRESKERVHQNGEHYSSGEILRNNAATITIPRARSREIDPYQK